MPDYTFEAPDASLYATEPEKKAILDVEVFTALAGSLASLMGGMLVIRREKQSTDACKVLLCYCSEDERAGRFTIEIDAVPRLVTVDAIPDFDTDGKEAMVIKAMARHSNYRIVFDVVEFVSATDLSRDGAQLLKAVYNTKRH